jgi:hypothetical protein
MGVGVVCWVLFGVDCYVALIVVVLGIICSESVIDACLYVVLGVLSGHVWIICSGVNHVVILYNT